MEGTRSNGFAGVAFGDLNDGEREIGLFASRPTMCDFTKSSTFGFRRPKKSMPAVGVRCS